MSLLINEAMRLERERHLGVSPFERSPEWCGYANGFKPKTVKSRVGALSLAVPQVREGRFYPQSLDKGLRSERALKLALAEMHVTGVSTRKIARVTQELCGFEVSSSEVSRCAAELDDEAHLLRDIKYVQFFYAAIPSSDASDSKWPAYVATMNAPPSVGQGGVRCIGSRDIRRAPNPMDAGVLRIRA